MLILTGPTAAGKNIVSHIIARSCPQSAIVDAANIIKKYF
jgi:dephospho-CoA kinase